jgi:hypothetical protein
VGSFTSSESDDAETASYLHNKASDSEIRTKTLIQMMMCLSVWSLITTKMEESGGELLMYNMTELTVPYVHMKTLLSKQNKKLTAV